MVVARHLVLQGDHARCVVTTKSLFPKSVAAQRIRGTALDVYLFKTQMSAGVLATFCGT